MKNINLGKATILLEDYASQGNAILGIRDSGKSYTATSIGEQLMGSGIPILAFDPIGIWRYLRVPGAGKGYKVVVAGGQHGDLPLTARGAQEIVRAAMRENVSLVIDLYDIRLSKADWREIVASSIRTLLYENGGHGLRHIFIEEAAEFCPQNVGDAQGIVYAEVEKLARMGGNAMLGYTLINQRAEQVNKAVLELCDCLILHRQKGRNSINALSKWLDVANVTGGAEIIKSLPSLAQGECWVWPAGSDTPVRTKVPRKNSFHPDRRARQAPERDRPAEVDVSAFVESMKGSLETLTKEAEENDPKLLRAKIAQLEREAKKTLSAVAKASPSQRSADTATIRSLRKALEEAMKVIVEINAKDFFKAGGAGIDKAAIESAIAGATQAVTKMVERHLDQRNKEIDSLKRDAEKALGRLKDILEKDVAVRVDVRHNEPFTVTAPAPAPRARIHEAARPTDGMTAPQQRILDALAWWASIGVDRPDKGQVGFIAGYRVGKNVGGTFGNLLGQLRSQGLIEYPAPGEASLTDAGMAVARMPAEKANTETLHAAIQARLDGPEWRVLSSLIEAYPSELTKQECGARAGYSVGDNVGGTFGNILGRLRSLGLIDYPGAGRVVALPVLFLHG